MARRSPWRRAIDAFGRLGHSRLADRLFWISILLKAVDGTLETVAGLVLLATSKIRWRSYIWCTGSFGRS
jgi:hypothetical protein